MNGPSPKNKENHGPLLKELLKLLFLFLSVKAYEGLYSYGVGPSSTNLANSLQSLL